MKSKTIKKYLSENFNNFVDSITDEKVRELVRKNSIITGGSIVSLLLNEKVNDYDIYFTDKETTKRVANYYVKLFIATNPEYRATDLYVKEDEETGRISVFCKSSGVAIGVNEGKYVPACLTTNAITLTNDIQLVLRFYGEPEEIHKYYDFVHATNYWTSKDNKLVLNPKALECILTKELLYNGSKYPLCSIIRTKKFIRRGWTINAGQYLKMALQLNELDLLDPVVLEEQLTGVDSAYFTMFIRWFRNNKQDLNKTEIVPYLTTVIDRIFDGGYEEVE